MCGQVGYTTPHYISQERLLRCDQTAEAQLKHCLDKRWRKQVTGCLSQDTSSDVPADLGLFIGAVDAFESTHGPGDGVGR